MLKGFVWEKVAGEQGWQFYLFCPALFVSSIHEVLGIKFKGGYRPFVAKGHVTFTTSSPGPSA